MQIRAALNQQTAVQFAQYAQQQCPNNKQQVSMSECQSSSITTSAVVIKVIKQSSITTWRKYGVNNWKQSKHSPPLICHQSWCVQLPKVFIPCNIIV